MADTLRTTTAEFDGDLANKTFSVKRAAKISGYPERSLRERCRKGTIPGAIKIGRSWRIPARWLKRYLPEEFWSAVCPHCGCQFNALEAEGTAVKHRQLQSTITEHRAQGQARSVPGPMTVILVLTLLLATTIPSARAVERSDPKLPDPIAAALAEKGNFTFVNENIDVVSYHPLVSFAPQDPSASRICIFKHGEIVGIVEVVGTRRMAYIALGNLTHQETAQVLSELAEKLGPRPGLHLLLVDLLNGEKLTSFRISVILIFIVSSIAVSLLFGFIIESLTKKDSPDSDNNPGSPPDGGCDPVNPPESGTPPDSPLSTEGEENMKQENLQKTDPGCLEVREDPLARAIDKLRPDPARIPEIPLNDHSHEFEGRFSEVWKRGRIRSHTLTEQAQTELATQRNAFLEQAAGIVQKNNQVRRDSIIPEIDLRIEAGEKLFRLQRMRLQAEVDDLKVDLEKAEIQTKLAMTRKGMALELDKLDAQILAYDKPKNTSHNDREASRLQQEIDNISRKVSTIAGLEQACADMKARSPQHFGPIIDRLFRKVIDTKKENL